MKLLGQQRADKRRLINQIERIDLIAESRLLSFEEWKERIQAKKELVSFELMEEKEWKQKAGKKLGIAGGC